MAIKTGSTDVTDIKVGETNVNRVCVGSTVVWERGGETKKGVWRGTVKYADQSPVDITLTKGTGDDYFWSGNANVPTLGFITLVLRNGRNGIWNSNIGALETTIMAPKNETHLQYSISTSESDFTIDITWSAT